MQTSGIKAALKLLAFGIAILTYFVISVPLYLYSKVARYHARKLMRHVLKFYCCLGLKIFNIKVTIDDPWQSIGLKGLIVSNHLSYLDILVIASYMPACFVTSIEVRKTFFLGQIVEAAGCLFVERRSRTNIENEISDVAGAINAGVEVLVFPEATSTNGENVIRFKRPLFNATIATSSVVKPITINYEKVNGETINTENRDRIFWYGDMDFFPHFWSFLKTNETIVSLTCSEPFYPRITDDKTTLASRAYDSVSQNYKNIGFTISQVEDSEVFSRYGTY